MYPAEYGPGSLEGAVSWPTSFVDFFYSDAFRNETRRPLGTLHHPHNGDTQSEEQTPKLVTCVVVHALDLLLGRCSPSQTHLLLVLGCRARL